MSKYKSGDIVIINNSYYTFHRNNHFYANTKNVKELDKNGKEFETKKFRPFLLINDPKDKNIFWAIPFTSKTNKFIDLKNKVDNNEASLSELGLYNRTVGSNLVWYCNFNGKDNAALMLSHAMPCLESDIHNFFLSNSKKTSISPSDINNVIDRFNQEIKHRFYVGEETGYLDAKIYNEVAYQSMKENFAEDYEIKNAVSQLKYGNDIKSIPNNPLKVGTFFEYENHMYQIQMLSLGKGKNAKVNAILLNMDTNMLSLQIDWCSGKEFNVDDFIVMKNNDNNFKSMKNIAFNRIDYAKTKSHDKSKVAY